MFEIFRELFRRKKKKEEAVMLEKEEFTLKANDQPVEDMPSSRYTEEYAEFVERQDAAAVSSSRAAEEKTLEEQMLEDPFADVAAQDADVEVEPVKKESVPEEPTLKEQMLEDPFADVAAQDEDPE